ncbi:hypothetical protein SpCBS45565_g02238 [Spizellomyces sp. 'palustris']|nr:hypothetical protein SpCBS45565_g02238 [Spizellomyces sp. 'palustris']
MHTTYQNASPYCPQNLEYGVSISQSSNQAASSSQEQAHISLQPTGDLKLEPSAMAPQSLEYASTVPFSSQSRSSSLSSTSSSSSLPRGAVNISPLEVSNSLDPTTSSSLPSFDPGVYSKAKSVPSSFVSSYEAIPSVYPLYSKSSSTQNTDSSAPPMSTTTSEAYNRSHCGGTYDLLAFPPAAERYNYPPALPAYSPPVPSGTTSDTNRQLTSFGQDPRPPNIYSRYDYSCAPSGKVQSFGKGLELGGIETSDKVYLPPLTTPRQFDGRTQQIQVPSPPQSVGNRRFSGEPSAKWAGGSHVRTSSGFGRTEADSAGTASMTLGRQSDYGPVGDLQNEQPSSASTLSSIFHCIHPGCPKTFKKAHSLKSHSKCHAPRTFTCPHCTAQFRRNHDLRRHMRSLHSNDEGKPHACDVCGKKFARSDALRRHVKRGCGNAMGGHNHEEDLDANTISWPADGPGDAVSSSLCRELAGDGSSKGPPTFERDSPYSRASNMMDKTSPQMSYTQRHAKFDATSPVPYTSYHSPSNIKPSQSHVAAPTHSSTHNVPSSSTTAIPLPPLDPTFAPPTYVYQLYKPESTRPPSGLDRLYSAHHM